MKRFAFLQLFPTPHPDMYNTSGNKVMDEHSCSSFQEAVIEFRRRFPHLNLNDNGYSKVGNSSFCIAEYFC